MSPFELVVIDKAREEVVAEIRVEAGIVLVRITPGLPRWRECVFRVCAVDHAERGQRYQCFLHGVAQAFFDTPTLMSFELGTISPLGQRGIDTSL
jgi:hypothetical protein